MAVGGGVISTSETFALKLLAKRRAAYRCAILAARFRATITANLARLILASALRAIFEGTMLMDFFKVCPQSSARLNSARWRLTGG